MRLNFWNIFVCCLSLLAYLFLFVGLSLLTYHICLPIFLSLPCHLICWLIFVLAYLFYTGLSYLCVLAYLLCVGLSLLGYVYLDALHCSGGIWSAALLAVLCCELGVPGSSSSNSSSSRCAPFLFLRPFGCGVSFSSSKSLLSKKQTPNVIL